MNRLRIVAIVAATVLLLAAFSAHGAELTYQPESVGTDSDPLELEAGASKTFPLEAILSGAGFGSVEIKYLTGVSGNLPPGWVTSDDDGDSLSFDVHSMTHKGETEITIKVPEDAEPDKYSGYVNSSVTVMGKTIEKGVYVSLVVPAAGCTEAPEFSHVEVGPMEIWAPNNRDVEIEFSGMVTLPEGCENTVTYELIDDQGDKDVPPTALLDDPESGGKFGKSITVSSSRLGKNKKGRTYTLKVSASNDAGSVEETFNIKVTHDQRNKKK